MTSDKHHQPSFLLKNVLVLSIKDENSPIVHLKIAHSTNQQHWTNKVQIAELFSSTATGSYTQYESF
jgi:hypothetical protein